jgi:hypothetical protein
MRCLGHVVNLYIAAKKWDMAAAVAGHLVKVDPGTADWWISLAYAIRRSEGVEKAEAILLGGGRRLGISYPRKSKILSKPSLTRLVKKSVPRG